MAEYNPEYLYCLDYSDNTICEIILDEKDDELNTEEILHRRHMNIDTCAYMYSSTKINNITEIEIG